MVEPGKPQEENTYLIASESGTEMARLLDLDRIMTESMGGLLPPEIVLPADAAVLDVACGPGGWVQELAFTYPAVEVTGIDISSRMINYARAQARVQNLENAHFRVMDALQPLDFPDASFYMLNMRLAVGFMPPNCWDSFLREAIRVTQPGGIIRLTDTDGFGHTTGEAIERLGAFVIQAMHKAGRTYSVLGNSVGLTPMLRRFLVHAGCKNIQSRAFRIEGSYGTPSHAMTTQNLLTGIQLMKPTLLRLGIVQEEEFERLYGEAMQEIHAPDFSAISYGLSVWGTTRM